MSNTRDSWDEVLSKIEGLGMKLKYHLESEMADDDATEQVEVTRTADGAGDITDVTDVTDSAEATGAGAGVPQIPDLDTLKEGVERFVDMIDDAFDALGEASRDAAVRMDMRDIAESLRNALAATWNDAGADLREILTRPKRVDDDVLIGEIIDPDADDTPASD